MPISHSRPPGPSTESLRAELAASRLAIARALEDQRQADEPLRRRRRSILRALTQGLNRRRRNV